MRASVRAPASGVALARSATPLGIGPPFEAGGGFTKSRPQISIVILPEGVTHIHSGSTTHDIRSCLSLDASLINVHPSLEQDLTPPLKTRLKVTSDFTLSLPRPHSYTQMRLRICACRRVIGKSNVGCQLDIARHGDW